VMASIQSNPISVGWLVGWLDVDVDGRQSAARHLPRTPEPQPQRSPLHSTLDYSRCICSLALALTSTISGYLCHSRGRTHTMSEGDTAKSPSLSSCDDGAAASASASPSASATRSASAPSTDAKEEKMRFRRQRILGEILSTERSYVKTLTTAVNWYLIPLANAIGTPIQPLEPTEIEQVFCNIAHVQRANASFLADLEGAHFTALGMEIGGDEKTIIDPNAPGEYNFGAFFVSKVTAVRPP